MKIYKIISLSFALLLLLLVGCDPIVDHDELKNSFNPDDIKLEVIQSTPGGNQLSIRMVTPGVTGYWDYNIDIKYTDRVDVVYPIPGESTFTFHVTTAYMPDGTPSKVEYIKKSVKVKIDKIDHELAPPYYNLTGKDLKGKTWVFNGTTNDGGFWWYMCPGDDKSKWETAWWNAGGTGVAPADVNGKMVFDLNGGANYTYYESPTADGVKGTFAFNGDYSKITIGGKPKILGNEKGNAAGVYEIVSLTETKMILYVPTNAGGTGWAWVFKAL